MKFIQIFFIQYFLINFGESSNYPLIVNPKIIIDNEPDLIKLWSQLYNETNELLFPHKKRVINSINYISALDRTQVNITDNCLKSLNQLKDGLINNNYWAYKCK